MFLWVSLFFFVISWTYVLLNDVGARALRCTSKLDNFRIWCCLVDKQ